MATIHILWQVIQSRYITFSHCETAITLKTAPSKQTLCHNVKPGDHTVTDMQKDIVTAVP